MIIASKARERFELAAQINASCDAEQIFRASEPLVKVLAVRLNRDSDVSDIIEHHVCAKELKILLGMDDCNYMELTLAVPLNTPLELLVEAGWFVGTPTTNGLVISTVNDKA